MSGQRSTSSGRQGGSGRSTTQQDGGLAETVSQQASQVKSQIAEQADAQADDRKQQVAWQMSSLASAISNMGSSMRQDSPQIAQLAETAAGKLNLWSDQLERKDLGELMDDVERFARDNPAVFIGGAFVLGLLGSRFLKASAPESDFATGRGRSFTSSYSGYRSPGSYSGRTSGSYSGSYSGSQSSAYSSGTGRRSFDTPLREAASQRDVSGYDTGRTSGIPATGDTTGRDYRETGPTDGE